MNYILILNISLHFKCILFLGVNPSFPAYSSIPTVTPTSNLFYDQGGYYQLPGQFDLQYVQPVPPYSYPVNKTFGVKPPGQSKKPFYIHVNPVYPTSEKFDILAPYPQVKVPPVSPFPTSTFSSPPVETTSEYPVTGPPKVTPIEEVAPETTPFVTATPEETSGPETSPAVTTVSADFFRPTEPTVYSPVVKPGVIDLGFRQPIPRPINLLPPSVTVNSFNRYPGFGQVSTSVPGQAGVIVPSGQPAIVPSVTPYVQQVPNAGLPQSSFYRPEVTAIPYSGDFIQPAQIPASCPCYVMSKNENGVTSTTTQSPVQAINNPTGGFLVMIYPLCPGDSVENIKKQLPAQASTFVIPYQCGACAGQNLGDVQQFDTFQEALDKGAHTFNKPSLILNKNLVQRST